MSKQPAMPFTYATYLSGDGKCSQFVFGNPGARVGEQETGGPSNMEWPDPRQSALPLVTRTFEFRLSGSETQEQALPVPGPADRSVVVAVNNVRAYLTGSGETGVPQNTIGGIEVWAECGQGAVVCRARLSDFAAGDLVVVRADVAVYRMDT